MDGKVDWYGEDVVATVLGATDETLTAQAFVAEGEIKVGIVFAPALDTGFMLNTVYTIPVEGPVKDKGQSSGMFKSKATGEMVERKRVDAVPRMPPHTAGVHAAAEYTIYQEMKHHFMYKGLQKAVKSAGGILKAVSRRRGL